MLPTYTRKKGTQGIKWRWIVKTQINISKQTILHASMVKTRKAVEKKYGIPAAFVTEEFILSI
jgi:hypothetical protein